MNIDHWDDPEKQQLDEIAAQMDAAVKKAEDAERRMHKAETGPLETMGSEEPLAPNHNAPGTSTGGPG
jgi:hypothetical protein